MAVERCDRFEVLRGCVGGPPKGASLFVCSVRAQGESLQLEVEIRHLYSKQVWFLYASPGDLTKLKLRNGQHIRVVYQPATYEDRLREPY